MELSNPTSLDSSDAITDLRHLNETSILHLIKAKALAKKFHTHVAIPRDCLLLDVDPSAVEASQNYTKNLLESLSLNNKQPVTVFFPGVQCPARQNIINQAIFACAIPENLKPVVQASIDILQLFSTTVYNDVRCIRSYTACLDHNKKLVNLQIANAFIDLHNQNYKILSSLNEIQSEQLRRELYLSKTAQKESTKPLIDLFSVLNIQENIYKPIVMSVAAFLHLRSAGCAKSGKRWHFSRPEFAHKACALMGISEQALSEEVFTTQTGNNFDGQDNYEAFLAGFYGEVYNKVIALLNANFDKFFEKKTQESFSISFFETPGLKPQSNNLDLNDLITNYITDRMTKCYLEQAVYKHQDIYQEEDIHIELGSIDQHLLHQSITAIDAASTTVSAPPNGLFSQLEYCSLLASSVAGNEGFKVMPHVLVQRIINADIVKNSPNSTLNSCTTPGWLKVGHGVNGTWSLEYDIELWSKNARTNPVMYNGWRVFENSTKPNIKTFFNQHASLRQQTSTGLLTAIGGMTLPKRTMTRAMALRKNSVLAAVQHAAQIIDDALNNSEIRTFTILSSSEQKSDKSENLPLQIDVSFLRKQIKTLSLLNVARMHKQGYPEKIMKDAFYQRFLSVMSNEKQQEIGLLQDKDKALKSILNHFDINTTKYKIGKSRILFRNGVIKEMEDKRGVFVKDFVMKLQAHCRGYLVRKKIQGKNVEVIATRCIQRNIRAYLELKTWPWWQLFAKLLPLVETSKTDREMREMKVSFFIEKTVQRHIR